MWPIISSSEECKHRKPLARIWTMGKEHEDPVIYYSCDLDKDIICTPDNCPRGCMTEEEAYDLFEQATWFGAAKAKLIAKLAGRDDGHK